MMGSDKAFRQESGSLPQQVLLDAFRQALDLASAYAGATAPNPPVGCVLLDSAGRVLARGAHERAGTGHAEARALAAARANGTLSAVHTVVVTLEPCNHVGRTPACSMAILASPARHVLVGAADPNPHVAGGGMARLRAGGLDVRQIASLGGAAAEALANEAARLIAPFAKHSVTGRPFVTVKQALMTDGSMIPPEGQKTFTSAASLDLAHRLRRRADAILTGSGTVLADDPAFTVRRVADFPEKMRFLTILDRRGRVSQAYLAAARDRGFQLLPAATLDEALFRLGAAGVLEVLVEAGPALTAAVLSAGLWDEHVVITRSAGTGADDVRIQRRTMNEFSAVTESAA
ncbi:bifunctional diaminohydroxyphosphoribosylaminopyrimidine deaminase/5-amino-6-(5-phosphoribosylamino)uracil reductase RibD [Martelella alba]|nr:bifunctional diaminohydroxyphosphoribosylaminopyrimidine deaminase/5-amino-6-(5-phosphoribosylamino)uracil reductase RibD [Martelella alba]